MYNMCMRVFYLEFKNTNVHTSASIVNQPDSNLSYGLWFEVSAECSSDGVVTIVAAMVAPHY